MKLSRLHHQDRRVAHLLTVLGTRLAGPALTTVAFPLGLHFDAGDFMLVSLAQADLMAQEKGWDLIITIDTVLLANKYVSLVMLT